ncbi:enoyl-CoA hydratase-related protein [Hydrogenophaga sp.]|uniref:enoyl-CoA hydratase-related protein n=1 Tax=Hydrogenophaga sp. TaxID=1904254 RepID=UPI002725F500|nr:enoyl-CoA hydratase-related protein [Hydrogenophaga sp.]MDO9435926.1 enoyl-CoA hydratase-related protein [Hydrogenophaga sp.]
MNFEDIRYEVENGIATVTLIRPAGMNSVTARMRVELQAAADMWDADDDVRVVIVTGEGPAFCAGADLTRTRMTGNERANETHFRPPVVDGVERDGGGQIALRFYESRKPMIGAINGVAAGMGATMLLPMDIRLASDTARFGFVFVRRGIVPESCSSWFLPRIVGISTALEWFCTGRVFGAAEALNRGLVSEVVAPDALLKRANALAREIADATAPVSVALARHMAWSMLSADHPMEAHRMESSILTERRGCPDTVEGIKAFLEKRSPSFPMRVSTDMPSSFPGMRPREFRADHAPSDSPDIGET